jgi:Arc/MetJ-type ribon-helix-helix transcriptional regulator
MPPFKIVIALEAATLEELDRLVRSGVFPSRSRAIQEALAEKLERPRRARLAGESAKLDPEEEGALADECHGQDARLWPAW